MILSHSGEVALETLSFLGKGTLCSFFALICTLCTNYVPMTSLQSGVRACVLSPTRELALQTFKFVKEIGKYTGLRACLLVGGDSMEDQFALLHSNPDMYELGNRCHGNAWRGEGRWGGERDMHGG